MAQKPTNKLSVCLIKNGLKPEDILRESNIRPVEIKGIGTFYYAPHRSSRPDWVSGFFGTSLNKHKILSSSPKGALLVTTKISANQKRTFALTFGYGRSLLDPSAIEDRFGLKVAVNIANPHALRRIDKKHLSSMPKDTREQLSWRGAMADFGFDLDQDLLQAVTAQTLEEKQEWFGKNVDGKEALSISSKIDISNVRNFLRICYAEYKSFRYKKNFDWIDQLAELRNPKDIDQLNKKMITGIQQSASAKTWIAVPELIEWHRVAGFSYGKPDASADATDVSLGAFLNSLTNASRRNLNLNTFTKKHIFCLDAEGNAVAGPWQVYKCLYCEMEYRQNTYLLSNGKWYKIKPAFVEEVSRDYELLRASPPDLKLPPHTGQKENDYNLNAARQIKNICCMDRKIIRYGGGYSQVEFCDLLTTDKKIIHVKRYGQSSVLAHLFQQGFVSGSLFLADPEFRKKVSEQLPTTHKQLVDLSMRPDASRYTIVFAIISESSGDQLDLPFFSKVVLRSVTRSLQNSGYQVKLMKIPSSSPT